MNYFELYPGDYLRDTTRLSLLEHGAYLRLLMAYYAEGRPLPASAGELYLIVSAVSASDKAAVRKVADRFFPILANGERHNGRADAEIEKAQKRIDNARKNGAKNRPTNNPPDHPAGMPPGDPAGTQRHTHSGEALPDPTSHQETNLLRPLGDSEDRALEAPLSAPIPTDHPDWLAWTGHQQAQRRWSIARERLALGHLRQVLADGGDPAAVLRWALSRSLADLLDCHRRMRSDAEREAASDKRPGESLADASARRSIERLTTNADTRTLNGSLVDLITGPRLALRGPK